MSKQKKAIPFDFAIENLFSADPIVKPMFGAYAVYTGPRIVLILRDKDDVDSGVWLATTEEHHKSLKKDFPTMRSITIFGPGVSSWQLLPKDDVDFETLVNKACSFILKGDVRIGKIPKAKKKKSSL
ncbi:MAG: hypothetical protein M3R27_10585 [Bacteroidota bacterium]|nr:hypothetical protein [Bacteroidota bacterium]